MGNKCIRCDKEIDIKAAGAELCWKCFILANQETTVDDKAYKD